MSSSGGYSSQEGISGRGGTIKKPPERPSSTVVCSSSFSASSVSRTPLSSSTSTSKKARSESSVRNIPHRYNTRHNSKRVRSESSVENTPHRYNTRHKKHRMEVNSQRRVQDSDRTFNSTPSPQRLVESDAIIASGNKNVIASMFGDDSNASCSNLPLPRQPKDSSIVAFAGVASKFVPKQKGSKTELYQNTSGK